MCCETEYNYIYDKCPKCRGVKHNDVLGHIDDGVDLVADDQAKFEEHLAQQRKDYPEQFDGGKQQSKRRHRRCVPKDKETVY